MPEIKAPLGVKKRRRGRRPNSRGKSKRIERQRGEGSNRKWLIGSKGRAWKSSPSDPMVVENHARCSMECRSERPRKWKPRHRSCLTKPHLSTLKEDDENKLFFGFFTFTPSFIIIIFFNFNYIFCFHFNFTVKTNIIT